MKGGGGAKLTFDSNGLGVEGLGVEGLGALSWRLCQGRRELTIEDLQQGGARSPAIGANCSSLCWQYAGLLSLTFFFGGGGGGGGLITRLFRRFPPTRRSGRRSLRACPGPRTLSRGPKLSPTLDPPSPKKKACVALNPDTLNPTP